MNVKQGIQECIFMPSYTTDIVDIEIIRKFPFAADGRNGQLLFPVGKVSPL
jgi:hypothetical protein